VALADAVAEAFIDSGGGISDRYLRYLTQVSDKPITFKSKQRTPSLEMLDKLITGLRHFTDEEITLDNIVEYVAKSDFQPAKPREEQTTRPH
jgi:hypothetical protein